MQSADVLKTLINTRGHAKILEFLKSLTVKDLKKYLTSVGEHVKSRAKKSEIIAQVFKFRYANCVNDLKQCKTPNDVVLLVKDFNLMADEFRAVSELAGVELNSTCLDDMIKEYSMAALEPMMSKVLDLYAPRVTVQDLHKTNNALAIKLMQEKSTIKERVYASHGLFGRRVV